MRWLNFAGYVAIPVAFLVHLWLGKGQHWEPMATFLLAALGVIPLAHLMGVATEHLSARAGPTWGGLLNATFGNAAEFIIALVALHKGLNEVVKATLTGSILGNLLLVGGAAMFAGGWCRERQFFSKAAAETNGGLLSLGVAAMLMPAIYHYTGERLHDPLLRQHDHSVSLGTSVILLAVYGLGLLFTLRTHAHIFSRPPSREDAGAPGAATVPIPSPQLATSLARDLSGATVVPADATRGPHSSHGAPGHSAFPSPSPSEGEGRGEGSASSIPQPVPGRRYSSPSTQSKNNATSDHWSPRRSLVALLAASAGIGLVAELLVGSAEHVAAGFGWNDVFVGIILLAIIGNAAEHSTAITLALRNDMDTAMTIVYQSSLQIALFVTPALVLIGTAMHATGLSPAAAGALDMLFSPMEVAAVVLTVGIIIVLCRDGQTNWFEGVMLLALYAILAVAFFNLPASAASTQPAH